MYCQKIMQKIKQQDDGKKELRKQENGPQRRKVECTEPNKFLKKKRTDHAETNILC